jgi:hypothetical protein
MVSSSLQECTAVQDWHVSQFLKVQAFRCMSSFSRLATVRIRFLHSMQILVPMTVPTYVCSQDCTCGVPTGNVANFSKC